MNEINNKSQKEPVKLEYNSTLLNASKSTNFIYQLEKCLTKEQINDINATKKFVDKLKKINSHTNLVFKKTENLIFGNNLKLIDSLLPEIISNILVYFFSSNLSNIKDLTKKLRKDNPIGYDLNSRRNFYEYKIKHLLTDITLGMMPAKVWTGKYDATGGYLIVKENGDILAYHIFNRNEFEDYLFNNTKLETASTSRHNFGKIYEKDNKQFINLNLQIRLKK